MHKYCSAPYVLELLLNVDTKIQIAPNLLLLQHIDLQVHKDKQQKFRKEDQIEWIYSFLQETVSWIIQCIFLCNILQY